MFGYDDMSSDVIGDQRFGTNLTEYYHNRHLVSLLINAGADLERKDSSGFTVLHKRIMPNVVQNNRFIRIDTKPANKTIVMLLKEGADVHSRNKVGESVLFNAIRYRTADIVQMLLDRGAITEYRDASYAMREALLQETMRKDTIISAILSTYIRSRSNMIKSASAADPSLGTIPISHGIPELIARYSLLSLEISHGSLDTIKILLQHGYDVNREDMDRMRPLFIAIYKRRGDIVRLLLDNGADISLKVNNKTALEYARTAMADRSIIEMLTNAELNKSQ